MDSIDSEILYFVKTLTRGLAHKIRTPLSVISNELSYLPSEDLLSPKQCKKITDILKQIQIPEGNDFGVVELSTLLKQLNLTPSCVTSSLKFKGSIKLFQYAIEQINNLLDNSPLRLDIENKKLILTYHFNDLPQDFQTYHSFSEYFCDKLGRDTFTPPLIDIALRCNRADTLFERSKIVIEVPLL